MRLDKYVAQYWPDYSRATWQKFIKKGYVSVNNHVVMSVKHELGEDDIVSVDVPDEPDFSSKTLPIIYQDDNVVVINKPVGILTHAKGPLTEEFTVASFFATLTSYKNDTNRPGIVHRLDRATSGVLIGVKNNETARLIQKQFSQRTLKKTYAAVLDGIPKEPQALIDLPIERNPKSPSTFRVGPNGKAATTSYKVIKSNKKLSLVELRPATGRTHQLRVHMSYLNTPIHGDNVYGKSADRLYLHAETLELTLPGGERKTFTAPVPPEFEELIA